MSYPLPSLPPRPPDGHKGTFGTVCVLGGQSAPPRVMVGGPAFAALGALRSGAGLAVLAVPRPIMPAALTIAPSAIGLALPVDEHRALRPSDVAALLDAMAPKPDCLAVGPGLGEGAAQQQIVARLIATDNAPLVIDADGLNALAALRGFDRDARASMVLTPHPGEFKRLASALGLQADPVSPQDRSEAAALLANRLGCVVVLKGHGTVISDGIRTSTNTTGCVALATAGTGDVLTGVIAGFIAQCVASGDGPTDLYECARLAVHVHGLAADRWADRHGDRGLLASDLLAELPDAARAVSS